MKIAEVIDKPEKWTKHMMAQDQYGNEAAPSDPEAVCWCLVGAGIKAHPDRYSEGIMETYAWDALALAVHEFITTRGVRATGGIGTVNDHHCTYEDAYAIAKRADEILEAQNGR